MLKKNQIIKTKNSKKKMLIIKKMKIMFLNSINKKKKKNKVIRTKICLTINNKKFIKLQKRIILSVNFVISRMKIF